MQPTSLVTEVDAVNSVPEAKEDEVKPAIVSPAKHGPVSRRKHPVPASVAKLRPSLPSQAVNPANAPDPTPEAG